MVCILSGEKIARRILNDLKKKRKKKVSLAVVQVGENSVSAKYIGEKRKVAKELGIGFRLVLLPAHISQAKLEQEIRNIGEDPKVSGMIVQLPLPRHINAQRALDKIPLKKDVDALSKKAFELFKKGKLKILPPTICAISLLFKEVGMFGKAYDREENQTRPKVTIVGKGRLVGLPLSFWFQRQGIEPVMVDKTTPNIPEITRQADIVISAVGKPGLITGGMVKKGAVVIDAGTSVEGGPPQRGEARPALRGGPQGEARPALRGGSTKGDVDFESVSKKASFLTPVPGGVGPLTVACLFKNLFFLTQNHNQHYYTI